MSIDEAYPAATAGYDLELAHSVLALVVHFLGDFPLSRVDILLIAPILLRELACYSVRATLICKLAIEKCVSCLALLIIVLPTCEFHSLFAARIDIWEMHKALLLEGLPLELRRLLLEPVEDGLSGNGRAERPYWAT